jgi:hypothetical protein
MEVSMLKCIGCMDLLREEVPVGGKTLVVYNCPSFFPYACALSGLFRPTSNITKAIEECPKQTDTHCILCENTDLMRFGRGIVYVCEKHVWEWSKWLDDHLGKREHIAPKGRLKQANWVEVFREFIESKRERSNTPADADEVA